MNLQVIIGICIVMLGAAVWLLPKLVEYLKNKQPEKPNLPELPEKPEAGEDSPQVLFYHFDEVRKRAPECCYKKLTDMMPELFAHQDKHDEELKPVETPLYYKEEGGE